MLKVYLPLLLIRMHSLPYFSPPRISSHGLPCMREPTTIFSSTALISRARHLEYGSVLRRSDSIVTARNAHALREGVQYLSNL